MATPKQAGRVSVSVVCIAGGRNFVKDMLVPAGQTIGWCVNASGLYGLEPDFRDAKMGIWGKVVVPDTEVHDGDRLEVYVPCDPQAQVKARAMKRSGIANKADLSHNAG